ncbi:MAG: ATP-binding protein [Polyangiaceae bacterium]
MPNTWYERTFEEALRAAPPSLRLFPVWLLLGSRQVGKSSLLKHCAPERTYINLDDLATRVAANRDPILFSRELKPPLIVDEIQYAPELLSPIKQIADATGKPGRVWLTGSQNFRVMEGVRETLAGRVAILHLHGLSDEEKRISHEAAPSEYFEHIVRTGFPRLCAETDLDARELYLSSYAQTYMERDVRELLRVDKRREFELFLRLCAARTAQVINYDDLARDAGVSAATVKSWLSVLEDSFLIALVQPEHANRSKRLIKSPKLYFLDAGLAAYLSGWRDAEALRLGPQAGAIFETHIFSELVKQFEHRAKRLDVRFWRTRDGQEIDLLVETGGRILPIEVKLGTPRTAPPSLARIRTPQWERGQVISLAAVEPYDLSEDWRVVPPWGVEL